MKENQSHPAAGYSKPAAQRAEITHDDAHPGATDFDAATRPGDLWPEAADARCSEFAALFAGTQPAPLAVV